MFSVLEQHIDWCGTIVSRLEQPSREVPHIHLCLMTHLVKMKNKNKMMVVLLIISALTAGLFPAYATPDRIAVEKATNIKKVKPVPMTDLQARLVPNTLTQVKPVYGLDLTELDESTVDTRISEAEKAEPIEELTGSVLWYLNTNGYTTVENPVTDVAQSRFRIRLQLVAEKIKVIEFGVLYKVHWGRVTHNGEQFDVTGYALIDNDGVFYMKLNGETAFKSIGRISPAWYGVRVAMKGYLVDDEFTYSHQMRGWAIPLTQNLFTRLRNHLQ